MWNPKFVLFLNDDLCVNGFFTSSLLVIIIKENLQAIACLIKISFQALDYDSRVSKKK